MPAMPEAKRTPASGAISGMRAGASGETGCGAAIADGSVLLGAAGGGGSSGRSGRRGGGHWRAVEREGLDLRLLAQALDLVADDLAGDRAGQFLLRLL